MSKLHPSMVPCAFPVSRTGKAPAVPVRFAGRPVKYAHGQPLQWLTGKPLHSFHVVNARRK